MAPLGIAILGSGIFATEHHKPGVEACELLKLVAAYSRSRASVEKAFGDSNVDLYSDDSRTLDDLLARKDIDAVIVAYASLASLFFLFHLIGPSICFESVVLI